MRRQSSYDRSGDHRYYAQSRSSSHSGGYAYDRPDARSASSYYDFYQYSNYNNTQYDYGRYPYSQQSFGTCYDQPINSGTRVDYGDYYDAEYRRYNDTALRNTLGNSYGYYREAATSDYRYPGSSTIQRGDSNGGTSTPSFDRYQSSKARLFSFGYRKTNRNFLTSPKKLNKLDTKINSSKSLSSEAQQEIVEDKVEEISAGTDSLAKLTLAMINYRISLSLLSLNLSIHTESNESTLFLRNQPSNSSLVAPLNTENFATKEGSKMGTVSLGSTIPVSSSISPAIVAPSLVTSHEPENTDICAGKRLLSGVDNTREDYPSNKRQRSQNADEVGMGRERNFTDESRDIHTRGYSKFSGQKSACVHDGDYDHFNSQQITPSFQRGQNYDQGSRYNSYYDNKTLRTIGYDASTHRSYADTHASPREYSGGRDHRYPGSARATSSNQQNYSHNDNYSRRGNDTFGGYPDNSYASGSSTRYYDSYDNRSREYSYSGSHYPGQHAVQKESSNVAAVNGIAYSAERDSREERNDRGFNTSPAMNSGSANYLRQLSSSSSKAPIAAGVSAAAPTTINAGSTTVNDFEEGEYRERSYRYSGRQGQQLSQYPQHGNSHASSGHGSSSGYYNNYSAATSSYSHDSSHNRNNIGHGDRDYYDYHNRKYSAHTPTQASSRDYHNRSGTGAERDSREFSASNNRYDRSDTSPRYSTGGSSAGPYSSHHGNSSQNGATNSGGGSDGNSSAPSSGYRGSSIPSLRTPR